MNRKNKWIIFVSILSLSFLVSCKKVSDYSNIPNIEFKETKLTKTEDLLGNKVYRIRLKFYLIDGDGDVGLVKNMGKPYVGDSAFNYFSELFYMKNNQWHTDTLILDSTKNFIIPYLNNFLGSSKFLKASVFIDYEYAHLLFKYDTIRYSFYVMDRAFNKSNIAFSDTIAIN